jgi:DNA-binding response OmpR family regulator
MRVLIVEDHAKLALGLATILRREGMAVDIAFDGQDALTRAAAVDYDVVVLDRDLPVVHGDDVCRAIVAGANSSRVLMLTAAGAISDRVQGLNLGADDYLPKPFASAELIARIRTLARRSPSLPPTLVHGDLELDTAQRLATRARRPLGLRPKEFAVLELLVSAQGAVVSTERILEHVWDDATDPFSATVRMTISRLRSKLGEPPLIETIAGVGYRI